MIVLLLLLTLQVCLGLDLTRIKELAIKNNLESVKSELELRKLEERIKEVRAEILPEVSLSARFTRWDPAYISAFVPENKYSLTLSLEQAVFNKTLWTALRIAKESKELQELIEEEVRNRLLSEVEKLYWAVLLKKEILKEKEESLHYWESYYELVREKYREGVVPKYEFLRAKARFREAKAELIKSHGEYVASLNSLKSFLGIREDVEIEGSLRMEDLPPDALTLSPEETNPTLRVLKKMIELRRLNTHLVRSERFPKLYFFFTYNVENVVDFEEGRLKEDLRRGYSFGLRMSMTLLDSGRTSARFMQERIEEVKSKRELSFTRVKVLSEVDTLKLQLRSALEEVKARRESLRAAEESLRYATERYREGVGSQVELLEARRAYEEAKLSYLNAIYLYNSVVADLKYFLGWHTKKTVEQQLGDSTGSKPMDFE